MPGMRQDDLKNLRIDIDRLVGRLEALSQIGDTGDGGNCRLALTDEDRDGRDLVVGWMQDLGLSVTVDTVGNVVAVYPGETEGPPVITGSHIDTVRTGGRYDGNLGVLAGLEVIETLSTAGVRLRRPLAVAFFTDEEGSRFPPDMLGSLTFVGGMSVEQALDVTDSDGVSVGAELDRIGYRGAAPCPAPAPFAFVELHIEQGPVLEQEGVTIGAVTGVQGISWSEVTIEGQSNHAGTTPMDMRRDAGYAAARVAVAAREIAGDIGGYQVATVGVMDLHPDLVNVVAGRARLCVDMRNIHEQELQQAERLMATSLERIAAAEGVGISARSMARFEPVIFDLPVVDLVEATALRLGHSTKRLPSGAGHDAQMLARVCPAGMIFVPSHRGLSHNPAEYTAPADLAAGADVLLQVMIVLACWEGDIPQVPPTGGTFTRSERGVGAPSS
ncbi:MAG: Zn-dependent hydrolase [bacterium]|nr:Zn-dependent hydrolase [bacterium]